MRDSNITDSVSELLNAELLVEFNLELSNDDFDEWVTNNILKGLEDEPEQNKKENGKQIKFLS